MSEDPAAPVSLPHRVHISPDVIVQELGDEMVLLDLQTNHYFGLEEEGMRMWQLLAKGGDMASVLEQYLDEYDVDEVTLRQDLANLISELVAKGLVTVQELK